MQNVKEFRKVPTFATAYRDLFKDTLVRLPDREAIKAYESFELNFIGRPQELTSSIDQAAKEKQTKDLIQQQTAAATGQPLHQVRARAGAAQPAQGQLGGGRGRQAPPAAPVTETSLTVIPAAARVVLSAS